MTVPGDASWGEVIELCTGPASVAQPPADADTAAQPHADADIADEPPCPGYAFWLSRYYGLEFTDESDDWPAKRIFEAFEADIAVAEDSYFDVDYRSEFAKIQESTFAASEPDTIRLHFFQGQRPAEGVGIHGYLTYVEECISATRELIALSQRAASAGESPITVSPDCEPVTRYKGYAILRTSSPTIGRTMVHPDCYNDSLPEGDTLANHIRTSVAEEVTVFGVPLRAIGVPFMQQDGNLLRCAHVTAWMSHYTAVLRGYVPRRASGHFASASGVPSSYGRAYPADGIPALEQIRILIDAGLPPDAIQIDRLMAERELGWHDRPALHEKLRDAASPCENKKHKRQRQETGRQCRCAEQAVTRAWFVENLVATVCRYLNSGLPVILNIDDHSRLICGYLRDLDLEGSGDAASKEVSAFIFHDDETGPYIVQSIEDLLDEIDDDGTASFSVLTPLPTGLWLGDLAAEIAAVELLKSLASDYMTFRPEWVESGSSALRDLFAAVTDPGPGQRYSLRTFAITASDFKPDYAARVGDPVASKVCGYATMPKYIWVSEVHDRELRGQGLPATVATLVFDGSAVSWDGVARPPDPLFIHVPGRVTALNADDQGEPVWEDIGGTAIRSGRWHTGHVAFLSARQLAARVKTAM